jgi:BirA family biotin operon repressor/biotin-[acetyl-CoA-carboxylase] ligase
MHKQTGGRHQGRAEGSDGDEETPHFSAVAPDLAPERIAEQLALLLPGGQFGAVYEPHGRCGSTNDLCAHRARQGAPEGLVVLADEQTSGRGRQSRRWSSSAGENLTFSLLLRPGCTTLALPPLTLLAGVAIAEALAAVGISPRLKWPNDVLCETTAGPRKLVGVLTEMATQRDEVKHVVLGIGINVNQTTFDPELTSIATSLRLLTDRPHDRAALLAAILGRLEARYTEALRGGAESFLPAWRKLAQLPQPCRVERGGNLGPLEGAAVDVDEDGTLLITNQAGTHRVLSGDIDFQPQ